MAVDGQPAGTGLHLSRAKLAAALRLGTQLQVRRDIATVATTKMSMWVGTFNGWETVDTHLMKVLHPSGQQYRYVPTYDHVVNTPTTPVVGTSPVRVIQYGNQIYVEGFVVGDPTLAPALPNTPAVDGIPGLN